MTKQSTQKASKWLVPADKGFSPLLVGLTAEEVAWRAQRYHDALNFCTRDAKSRMAISYHGGPWDGITDTRALSPEPMSAIMLALPDEAGGSVWEGMYLFRRCDLFNINASWRQAPDWWKHPVEGTLP